ncbi:hypothetical protein [Mangrovibacillus cuniculi]|uniref:Lipoprotein n=1 Tax=Mangrovibacillus cuniculi TaxID=2593652 RepID=A0A7S8CE09_9BACI|nr:hypothetical protein [Mangrovibacillus cuniculi]QPC48255.1 hypothetical protein G8O30_15675 [Mangrovibacillus cuniculi]
MRKSIAISILMSILLLTGCGENDRELVVGTYFNDDSISFEEDTAVSEPGKIDEFKELITNSSMTTASVDGLPDYVVVINNHKESTMELWTNFWVQDDGSMVFSRGMGSQEFFVIDPTEAGKISELVK